MSIHNINNEIINLQNKLKQLEKEKQDIEELEIMNNVDHNIESIKHIVNDYKKYSSGESKYNKADMIFWTHDKNTVTYLEAICNILRSFDKRLNALEIKTTDSNQNISN